LKQKKKKPGKKSKEGEGGKGGGGDPFLREEGHSTKTSEEKGTLILGGRKDPSKKPFGSGSHEKKGKKKC